MNIKKTVSIQAPILAAVAIVIIGGSFYGGMAYAKASKTTISGTQRQGGIPNGTGMMRQGATGGRMGGAGGLTTGDVVSKTANGFTVKLRDGGSKVVIIASSTSIGKMTAGSMDDITNGTGVVVMGTSNSDGSITASTVQIRSASGTEPGFGMPPMGASQQGGVQAPASAN